MGISVEQAVEMFAPDDDAAHVLDDDPPPLLEPLWHCFCELHGQRTSGGFSPNPITWADVRAWGELAEVVPTDDERKLLQRLDHTYLGEYHEHQKTKQRSSKQGGE